MLYWYILSFHDLHIHKHEQHAVQCKNAMIFKQSLSTDLFNIWFSSNDLLQSELDLGKVRRQSKK